MITLGNKIHLTGEATSLVIFHHHTLTISLKNAFNETVKRLPTLLNIDPGILTFNILYY